MEVVIKNMLESARIVYKDSPEESLKLCLRAMDLVLNREFSKNDKKKTDPVKKTKKPKMEEPTIKAVIMHKKYVLDYIKEHKLQADRNMIFIKSKQDSQIVNLINFTKKLMELIDSKKEFDLLTR